MSCNPWFTVQFASYNCLRRCFTGQNAHMFELGAVLEGLCCLLVGTPACWKMPKWNCENIKGWGATSFITSRPPVAHCWPLGQRLEQFAHLMLVVGPSKRGLRWTENKLWAQSVCSTDGPLNEVIQIAAALLQSWLDNSSPGYSMVGITW